MDSQSRHRVSAKEGLPTHLDHRDYRSAETYLTACYCRANGYFSCRTKDKLCREDHHAPKGFAMWKTWHEKQKLTLWQPVSMSFAWTSLMAPTRYMQLPPAVFLDRCWPFLVPSISHWQCPAIWKGHAWKTTGHCPWHGKKTTASLVSSIALTRRTW